MLKNQQGHILFIEATIDLKEIIMAYSDTYEIGCTSFPTAAEALENFKTNQKRYQLIITDVSLDSDSNGIALANGLKQLSRQKRMPAILAVTNNSKEDVRTSLLNAGINDVVEQASDIKSIASLANSLITNRLLLDEIDAQKEKLNRLMLTDSLTGLYNKHYLMDQTCKFIPLAKRQNIPLSFMTVKINSFQGIIDKYGHQAGDMVLQCVGILIKSTSRGEDIPSRFDTDGIITLLPYCDLSGAENKATRLEQAIRKLNPDNIEVTAKVQAASVALDTPVDWENLLK